MKKIFICICLLLLFISGCGNKKLNGYHEISYDEYVKLKENNDTFPLVIGRETCSACAMFKGTMEKFIQKYGVDVRYIDISKLSDEESKLLTSEMNITSTPTTVFFKDGEQTSVYYRIVGAGSMDSVVEAYKRMGYLNG